MRITATTTSNFLGLPEGESPKAKYIQDVEEWGNKNGQEGSTAVSQIRLFIENPERTNLSLYWCGLTNVPPLGFIAERIQVLNLGHNQLQELPESIKFPKLEVLRVSGNRDLKSIPPSLLDSPNFRELYLEKTQITKTLKELKQERQEDRAVIAFNLLAGKIEPRLPESSVLKVNHFIKEPSRYLTELEVWRKEGVAGEEREEVVSKIKAFIENPKNTKLSFLLRSLTNVPPLGFIAERIKVLNLEGNQLSEFSESLGQLHNLEDLDLTNNKFKELPKSLGQLHNLKRLYLTANQLKKLPEWLGELHNLKGLYLGANQLQELPKSLGQLHNLEVLVVTRNRDLQEIPSSLLDSPNLEKLYLEETQITKTLKKLREEWAEEKGRLNS